VREVVYVAVIPTIDVLAALTTSIPIIIGDCFIRAGLKAILYKSSLHLAFTYLRMLVYTPIAGLSPVSFFLKVKFVMN